MSLFQGAQVDAKIFWQKFSEISLTQENWTLSPLNHEILFSTLEKMRKSLIEKSPIYKLLRADLEKIIRIEEVDQSIPSLIDFISPHQLSTKLRRELGTDFPFELKRISFREDHFECWFPHGALVHITPNNSPLLNVFALIEGLLSGNVNLLKLARKDTDFAEIFFANLCALDSSGELKKYIYIHRVSSKNTEELRKFLSVANIISAWGNEESIASIKSLAPANAEVVAWGHKISMAYVTAETKHDSKMLDLLASEVCLNEQQACSSPQVIYLETNSANELRTWAKNFAQHLDQTSAKIEQSGLDPLEYAEINVQSEQVRLGEVLEENMLISSPRGDWRIFVEDNPALQTSPLFRSVWIKPLLKSEIVETLAPMKKYLQTVGLSASMKECLDLLPLLFRAGFLRVNPIGKMTDSYNGEPHDGAYALQKFCKRISFTDDSKLKGFASLEMIKRN